MSQRVAVTGLGVVSPLGNTLADFRGRLLEGASGAGPITVFDPASLPTRIAAQADTRGLSLEHKDRKVAFAIAAARDAVLDAQTAGMPLRAHYPPGSGGLSIGIGLELFAMPDMVRLLETKQMPPDAHPLTFLQTPSDICAHIISKEHGLGRPPLTHIAACAASTDAIGVAFRMLRDGKCAWMLAGGADSMLNPLGVGGFCKLDALTRRNAEPHKASRPFDRHRDGFLLGEGAGMLALEPLEAARARGAKVYAEIDGYGNSFDAYGISEPHPNGDGALLAMRRALDSAAIGPGGICYINAHGTSTPKNDPVEALAIRRLWGEHTARAAVSSTKSMLGHLISASGAVETVATVICGASGWMHATANLDEPDPACDLDHIRGGPRRMEHGHILKNSFGFGGQNAALVLHIAG